MKKLLITVAALIAIPSIAQADEVVRYKAYYDTLSVKAEQVGDVAGHVVAVANVVGLVTMGNGELAQSKFKSTVDFINGSGPWGTYCEISFNDGSQLWMRQVGETTMKGATGEIKGTLQIIGGKGRYAGAKGEGSITGVRYGVAPDPTQIFNDVTINLKK